MIPNGDGDGGDDDDDDVHFVQIGLGNYLMCKWYTVFIGKAPGVYSSWEEASAQVASYSNSSHRGFTTKKAAEQAYSDWVRKHGGSNVDSGKVGGVKVEGATTDRQLGLKLKNFIIFVLFIAIVVLWRWCARCAYWG
ncbi:Translational activator GCN1 [Hordeum vulgare]|nr:Translational activator GCN1 [Hordeum vulgare]